MRAHSDVPLTCPTCKPFARFCPSGVPVLGVGVRDEVQRDAGKSVELLRSLSIDVLVDFFKAVSVRGS